MLLRSMDTDMAHTVATWVVQYKRLDDDDDEDLTHYAVKKHGQQHGIDIGTGGQQVGKTH